MRNVLRTLPLVALAWLVSEPVVHASNYPLSEILPKEAAEKLDKAGVKTSEDLLAQGATPAARTKLAKGSGVTPKQLNEWVRMADLLRIKGVGPVMVKLLGAVGVTSVAKLKLRNAKNLYEKMMAANDKAKVTQNPPSDKHLENWIEQAKKLKVVVK